ncbi:MAG TPA: energy transducer TonB [Candidatus Angelobacter sp.]|nr:energy transducer TonB [Candidatus Angelobacter sp.]
MSATFAVVLGPLLGSVIAQPTDVSKDENDKVALTSLSQPVYPPMARIAHVIGTVKLNLQVRKDGSLANVVVVSGHPMLAQAALDSAQQSRFECRECPEDTTPFSLTYTFRFAEGTEILLGSGQQHVVQVKQVGSDVTVIAQSALISGGYPVSVRVRSAKCLYLWRCGLQWGGEDHYDDRVRSPKCLYLWKCGRSVQVSM